MVRQVLRARVRCALRGAIPRFSDLQSGTDLRFVVRNIFDLRSTENGNGGRQGLAKYLALIVSDDHEDFGRNILELLPYRVPRALAPRIPFAAGFDFNFLRTTRGALADQRFVIVCLAAAVVLSFP